MTAHKPSRAQPTRPRPRSQPLDADVAPPAVVRRRIASAIIGNVDASLGEITLLPHQQDAVDRIHHALHDLHVALLADDVGLGKTFVALAVARRYARVCIIAPAALLPMWRHAVARAQVQHIELRSIQSYSRIDPRSSRETDHGIGEGHAPATGVPNHNPRHASRRKVHPAGPGLVIIDEAHHVRTPTTRRYRSIAERVVGRDLLLMSATPLHNTPRDLAAPLALAMGEQAARLTPALLARVVVRRTHDGGRPAIREHPAVGIPNDRAVLNDLLALPSPLPAHDGAVAGALIRLGLLRAWCSSDAALSHALRMRVLRAEALQHALQSGRHPTTAELRSWLVGDHEVQLAFPELMARHAAEGGPLLDVLQRHLDAVRDLLRRQQRRLNRVTLPLPTARVDTESHGHAADDRATARDTSPAPHADAERVRVLKAILAAHPGTPVVAFSQFAATVRSIGRALSDIAGVGVLTGRRAQIASGAVSRGEVLAAFAPRAQERPPPPPHQRITLLLTTDLLAEGVNLQDAGVVVHLDLPWTDALRRQRVGRCVRVGSLHDVVHVYTFAPPDGVEAVMQLDARLRRKAGLSTRLIGRATPHARRPARANPGLSAAELASAVRTALAAWQCATHGATHEASHERTGVDMLSPASNPPRPIVAYVGSARVGFLAAVQMNQRDPASTVLLGGRGRRDADGIMRWSVSTSPRLLWPLIRRGAGAGLEPGSEADVGLRRTPVNQLRQVRRLIRRWVARQALHGHLRDARAVDAAIHRRVRAALDDTLSRVGPGARAPLAAANAEAISMLSRARGAAAEGALRQWLALRTEPNAATWLTWWRRFAVLCGPDCDDRGRAGVVARAAREPVSESASVADHQSHMVAALVFLPESEWKTD